MKKILILSLLAMSAGLLLALQLAKDPGYVLIAYSGWTFETSLFALLILIVLIVIALRLVYLLLAWLNPLRFFRSSNKNTNTQ
ncbi:MAG: heme biosynthesis HemY N-terminal domain-containing protein [Pseudohongiella sp.]|nr:heme biosynthesis HemY N-terminal domain-containing protein [Pseudohongiella sp.]MDO9520504.1 heme biosynthesis HemY N-terminal domain-containing protein [Pseudohongiella sp.]MDP2126488.1 heme biosynthesis HemY N-terminal domain-containing protein [Pseudohongiella sp.]